jgi:hypothetical protein
MLDLILSCEAADLTAIHIGFVFEYDVNQILRDVPHRMLQMLRWKNRITWDGYEIQHIPHKWFRVSRDGISATIWDVFGYFVSSYGTALERYDIGTEEQRKRIGGGKESRGGVEWNYGNIEFIDRYWTEEIALMPELMNRVRDILYRAGFTVTAWHGPSAIAALAMRTHGVKEHRGECPEAVQEAARYAYAGGRFEQFKAGFYDGPIYTADLNSAYAYACQSLPSLRDSKWRHVTGDEARALTPEGFGLYFVSYRAPSAKTVDDVGIPHPLFMRGKDGTLHWPTRVDNWYWTPEALCARETGFAEIREAWILDDNGERPFEWVHGMFLKRRALQQEPYDPTEMAYKWMLASIYGQQARRAGWEHYDGPPGYFQLEWAGFITSWCRAMVYRVARGVGLGLISIDTDGVASTTPFEGLPGTVGTGLGEWKLTGHSAYVAYGSGLYWTCNADGEWTKPKTRGIPRGTLDIKLIRDALLEKEKPLELPRKQFIGYRRALAHKDMSKWRTWQETDGSEENPHIKYNFGGGGKRYHMRQGKAHSSGCPACKGLVNYGGLCPLFPSSPQLMSAYKDGTDLDISYRSKPHSLPWLDRKDYFNKSTEFIIPEGWKWEL